MKQGLRVSICLLSVFLAVSLGGCAAYSDELRLQQAEAEIKLLHVQQKRNDQALKELSKRNQDLVAFLVRQTATLQPPPPRQATAPTPSSPPPR